MINANRNRMYSNIDILVGNFQDIEPTLTKYDLITLIGVWEYSASYIESEDDPIFEYVEIDAEAS